jgi:cytochrome oxidase Cu insertion factor (SCO1/SenC/PrrC family)
MSHKRAFRMVFALTLVSLFLLGCGSPPVSEAPAEEPTQEAQSPTEAPAAAPTAEPPTPTEEIATEEPAIDPLGTGDLAPDFTLPDSNGNMVNLADNLLDNRLVILVFYFSHT